MGGKRLRVVDFRAILCEKDDAHTLWYVLGVIVQKRAERCRYQSFASRIDTAQSEREKGTNGSKSVNYDLFLFRLIFPPPKTALFGERTLREAKVVFNGRVSLASRVDTAQSEK